MKRDNKLEQKLNTIFPWALEDRFGEETTRNVFNDILAFCKAEGDERYAQGHHDGMNQADEYYQPKIAAAEERMIERVREKVGAKTMTDEQRKGDSKERIIAQQYWNLALQEVNEVLNNITNEE